MLAQDVAGEVERAADQHVVRPRGSAAAIAATGLARPSRHAWPGRPSWRRAAADACGIAARAARPAPARTTGSRPAAAAVPGSCARSLVDSMPTTRCSRRPRSQVGQAVRPATSAGGRVVAAVEPDRGARRAPAPSAGPCSSRCSRAGQTALAKPRPMAASSRPGSPSCSAAMAASPAFADLVRARQRRARQVEAAAADLHPQPVRRRPACPVTTVQQQGRTDLGGARLDHRQRLGLLRPDHGRHAGLQDAGLLERDAGQRVAEIALMVHRDRRDQAQAGSLDDVGGVQPAAQPGLEQHPVGASSRRRRGRPRRW